MYTMDLSQELYISILEGKGVSIKSILYTSLRRLVLYYSIQFTEKGPLQFPSSHALPTVYQVLQIPSVRYQYHGSCTFLFPWYDRG